MIVVSPELLKRIKWATPTTLLAKTEANPAPLILLKKRIGNKDIQAGGPGSGRHPEGKTQYKIPSGYGKILSKFIPKHSTWVKHKDWKQQAYGGVLVNQNGEFLLREPTDHFDGYHWTFPKGKM